MGNKHGRVSCRSDNFLSKNKWQFKEAIPKHLKGQVKEAQWAALMKELNAFMTEKKPSCPGTVLHPDKSKRWAQDIAAEMDKLFHAKLSELVPDCDVSNAYSRRIYISHGSSGGHHRYEIAFNVKPKGMQDGEAASSDEEDVDKSVEEPRDEDTACPAA
eukprot:TRINITY_DN66366_c3_g2_i3.p1 TRINITY_DN66366_c3_g2~~TRINITY_DN66366_c3_g2_i3.p1  ORF type:complete len:159 (-),score=36.96 TRINITY_DN66366_c3_g2_i3:13-489(-)